MHTVSLRRGLPWGSFFIRLTSYVIPRWSRFGASLVSAAETPLTASLMGRCVFGWRGFCTIFPLRFWVWLLPKRFLHVQALPEKLAGSSCESSMIWSSSWLIMSCGGVNFPASTSRLVAIMIWSSGLGYSALIVPIYRNYSKAASTFAAVLASYSTHRHSLAYRLIWPCIH